MPNRVTRGKAQIGAGAINIIAQGSMTHAAGTASAGAQVSYSGAVTGAVVGDLVQVSANAVAGSATLYGSVQAAGTVSVTIHSPASGTVTWAAGTIFYRVERLS